MGLFVAIINYMFKKEMKNIINFLEKVGTLKNKERRGWVAHGFKNRESTADHIFRTTMLAWLLARKKEDLNMERVLKTALVHDVCEVYSRDETPYDPLLPRDLKDKKKIKSVLDKWPTFTLSEKRKKDKAKYKRELKGLERAASGLSPQLKKEIIGLWKDFEEGATPEGRFVKQIDKMENYFQGMEYWKKQGKIRRNLWARWAKEIIYDPLIVSFLNAVDKRFPSKK